MKVKRHAKILDIIRAHPVNTQEELLTRLNESGFQVTQATISRDIKELRLIKSLDGDGNYHYSTVQQESENISTKFHSFFAETVTNIDYAGNIVVVKCLSGMASAVCAALDALNRPNIVGTISGDDTFICIMRDENNSIDLVTELKKMLR
ncbi:MAG TPA: arginine repressor [Ruminococcaceae bacterium]|jgi:transcriptional regulator of arginine metabolism|nr:arginine repressor [Oscillospiraceae bacterium]HCA28306.1 arginine repressor [Oscillospiraceae bacterium]